MESFINLLRIVSRMLVECGCSSNRLENLLSHLGASWGYEVDTFALPTGVIIMVRQGRQSRVEMIRIRSWSVDLDRLSRINELVLSLQSKSVSVTEAEKALQKIAQTASPYNAALTILAGGLSSSSMIFFFNGPQVEIILGFLIGMVASSLNRYLFVGELRRYLADFATSAIVAVLAVSAYRWFPEIVLPRLIIGGIIFMVPGLVLVNAVHEIAQKNLVSGSAKLVEAFIIAVSLAFGVVTVMGLLSVGL